MLRKTPSRVPDFDDVMDGLTGAGRSNNENNLRNERSKTPTNTGFGRRDALKVRNITPSRNGDFKGATEGDRYIAQHDQDHLDYAKFKLTEETNLDTSRSAPNSPQKIVASQMIKHKSSGDVSGVTANNEDMDIFVWRRNGAPKIASSKQPNVLYTCMAPSSSVKRDKRVHCKQPVHILDAPGFTSDFYLNTLDWGSANTIAIGMDQQLYLWNASTGVASQFLDLAANATSYVGICCVKFTNDGRYLAVGLTNGFIQLYDIEKQACVRKFGCGVSSWRISAAAWSKSGLLSFGNRNGVIQTHDVKQKHSFLVERDNHNAEVCGLQWVWDDKFLVSGSADSIVNVYTAAQASSESPGPLFSLTQHLSTVKAIAQVPFMGQNVIATGGGTNDHCVKFWDLVDGSLVLNHDTGNQVSGINFDKHYKEMTTSHGQPKSVIATWKYNSTATEGNKFIAVNHLEQTSRVLSMIQSPCGEYVLSGMEDESIAIYDTYKKDEAYMRKLSPLRRKRAEMMFSGVRQRIR